MNLNIEENTEAQLTFNKSATPGSYTEIKWYKGSTDGTDRIVHYSNNTLFKYWGDYCSGIDSPCDASNKSDKGELDITTGIFTIKNLVLDDAGYYYYYFHTDSTSNTGNEYEYALEVYGKKYI